MAKEKAPVGGWSEYIDSLVQYVEGDSSGFVARNKKIEEQRDRRFMKRDPHVPTEYEKTATKFKSPFIFDICRRAPGLTSSELPTPKVTPYKLGREAQDNSTKREKWLKACYVRMDRGSNTFLQIMDALAADGMAVWKVILDKHSWAAPARNDGEDAKAYAERATEHHRKNFPFHWEQVSIDTVYPFYDENGLAELLQITKEDPRRMARKYGLVPTRDGKLVKGRTAAEGASWPTECKFIEYWNREWFVYKVDDVEVKRGRHGYERVPYFFAPLTRTSSRREDEKFYGLGFPLMSLQDTLDSLITCQLNWAYLNGFAYVVLRPTSQDAAPIPEGTVIHLEHGKPFYPPRGWEVVFLAPPSAGQDMAELRNIIKTVIDQVGLAPVLFGNLAGQRSNAAQLTAIAVAKSILQPGMQNIAYGFDEMAAFIQRQIEKLGEPVPVWDEVKKGKKRGGEWRELSPEDVDGYYEVSHQLEPILPGEQYQQYLYLADAQARGLVDKNYVREEGMGIGAPEEMDIRVKVEKFTESPQYLNVLHGEWLKKYHPQAQPQALGTPANLPIAPGGPGTEVIAGMQQGLMPGAPPAARVEGQGRGG